MNAQRSIKPLGGSRRWLCTAVLALAWGLAPAHANPPGAPTPAAPDPSAPDPSAPDPTPTAPEPSPAAPKTAPAQLQTIDLETFKAWLAEGDLWVLDANRPRTYARGRVPGARSIGGGPLTRAQLPADATRRVVLYCASSMCPASRMAARQALGLGHRAVYVYLDGLKGWIEAGQPLEPGVAKR